MFDRGVLVSILAALLADGSANAAGYARPQAPPPIYIAPQAPAQPAVPENAPPRSYGGPPANRVPAPEPPWITRGRSSADYQPAEPVGTPTPAPTESPPERKADWGAPVDPARAFATEVGDVERSVTACTVAGWFYLVAFVALAFAGLLARGVVFARVLEEAEWLLGAMAVVVALVLSAISLVHSNVPVAALSIAALAVAWCRTKDAAATKPLAARLRLAAWLLVLAGAGLAAAGMGAEIRNKAAAEWGAVVTGMGTLGIVLISVRMRTGARA